MCLLSSFCVILEKHMHVSGHLVVPLMIYHIFVGWFCFPLQNANIACNGPAVCIKVKKIYRFTFNAIFVTFRTGLE